MQYAALVLLVSLLAIGIDDVAMQTNETTGGESDSGFSFGRLEKCLPNILLSVESGADFFVRNWWLNDSLFLPEIVARALMTLVKYLASSIIPYVGSMLSDFLLEPIFEPIESSSNKSFSILRPGQIAGELGYLNNITSKVLEDVVSQPCLYGSEQPIAGEELEQKKEALRSKYRNLVSEYWEGLTEEISSRIEGVCRILPFLCRFLPKGLVKQ